MSSDSKADRIKPNETVTFFPTTADFCNGRWRVPIHGWIYRSAELSRLRRMGLWLARRVASRRVKLDAEQTKLFRQRAGAFLADNNRRRRVQIQLGDCVHALKRSLANGHFKGELELGPQQVPENSGQLTFQAMNPAGDDRTFCGCVHLLPPEGLSVISDIDDTIKVTGVANRRTMLRKTFLENFADVPEMAALYRQWQQTRGAAFHYVSASPWHLYPFLAEFLNAQGFPDGTFHLRDFRLMFGDLHRTFRPSRRIKLAHARSLMKRFPGRKFILVGDSGESDAQIYASLYRERPQNVEMILIRDVCSTPKGPDECRRALRGVPPKKWCLFQHPNQIEICF